MEKKETNKQKAPSVFLKNTATYPPVLFSAGMDPKCPTRFILHGRKKSHVPFWVNKSHFLFENQGTKKGEIQEKQNQLPLPFLCPMLIEKHI